MFRHGSVVFWLRLHFCLAATCLLLCGGFIVPLRRSFMAIFSYCQGAIVVSPLHPCSSSAALAINNNVYFEINFTLPTRRGARRGGEGGGRGFKLFISFFSNLLPFASITWQVYIFTEGYHSGKLFLMVAFFLFVFFSSYHRCARGPFLLVAVFLRCVPCPRLIYLVAVRNCRLVASSSSLCWSTTVALHLWDMPLLHHLIFSASWPVGCWVIVVLHCLSSTFNIILTRIFKSVAEQRGLCSWNGYLLLFFSFLPMFFFWYSPHLFFALSITLFGQSFQGITISLSLKSCPSSPVLQVRDLVQFQFPIALWNVICLRY